MAPTWTERPIPSYPQGAGHGDTAQARRSAPCRVHWFAQGNSEVVQAGKTLWRLASRNVASRPSSRCRWCIQGVFEAWAIQDAFRTKVERRGFGGFLKVGLTRK